MRDLTHRILLLALLAAPMCLAAQSDAGRNRLIRQVRHELVMLPYYGVFDNLAYRVEGDKVTLLGQVTRPTLKSAAENVVKDIEGVISVDNQIEVLPLSPNDDRLRMALYRAIYSRPGLNRHQVKLFEGDRDHLDEVELAAGVPRTITEALGSELTDPHQTVASYGGTSQGANMRHGHGSKSDEEDIDEERFFRVVDRAILENHSRPSGMPLILAALTQYHTPFRKISRNPFLTGIGIEVDANSLSTGQLRQRVWTAAEPEILSRLRKLSEGFEEARSKGLGTDKLAEVARAAVESRIESLFVESDRRIPGRLDKATGAIALSGVEDPQVDDLLDDLAELVLNRGGQVVVAPSLDMPTQSGVAAVLRF